MKIISKVSILFSFILLLALIQYLETDAYASSSYFTSQCASCHAGVSSTCNGCHAHGGHSSSSKSDINVMGTTDKTSYAPGETVTVTITGGYRNGWIRAAVFDQNNVELVRSSGNTSGMGSATSYPATLTVSAPTGPGTYTWKAAWYGNKYDKSSAAFGSGWTPDPNNPNHGYELVTMSSFTVSAPVDTTAPVVSSFTLPGTSNSLTIQVTSFNASDNVSVSGYLVTTSSTKPAANAAGWSATTPSTVTATEDGNITFYAWAKDAANNVSSAKSATVVIDTTSYHFPAPVQTLSTATFSGEILVDSNDLGQSQLAVVGDEIAVFDPSGVLCGRSQVSASGQFGPLVVYGDNASTSGDEGASSGDVLTFILWDSQRDMELAVRTMLPNGDLQTVTWADNGGGTVIILGLALDRIGVTKDGNWTLDSNDNGNSDSTDLNYMYGSATDTPIFGDWDGDGIASPGVKRGNTYYLRNSNNQGVADLSFQFGDTNDIPIVGDWDGDGVDSIGVKRGNTYYLRNSNSPGVANASFKYGDPNDAPIIGDWDGDGVDTIGVKRGNFYYLRNSNTSGMADIVLQYGLDSDSAIVGDWDGDGLDTVGVYRSSDGNFYLRNSLTPGMANSVFSFGIMDGKPFSGKW